MKKLEDSLLYLTIVAASLVCFSDTARAQNGTLVISPTELFFNAPNGTTPPAQTLSITSTVGPANITIKFSSDTNWLSVTPTSGTTPLQVSVSVNPALSTVTPDVGFITIISGSQSVTLVVELTKTAGSTGSGTITASPNSLSFNFPSGSTIPVTEDVSLSTNNSSITSFTASATTSNGGDWITLNPTSGSLPNTLQVTVNPAALSGSGPFSAQVAIVPPGTAGTTVQVNVTVGNVPAIQASVNQINFAWEIGTAAPAAQTVSITSTGSAVSFSAAGTTSSCGSNWLVVSPSSGVTPGSITVQVNTSGLNTAQSCSGQIQITAASVSNPTLTIPVSLLVTSNPLLEVPSTGPTFTYQIGTSTELAAQHVQITSSSGALNFSASAAPSTAGGPNFLTVSPSEGTTPQSLALTVNATVLAALAPGSYGETVTLTSPGAGNSPQTFPVTLTVNSNPLLTATVDSLDFNYEIGQTPPQSQTFTVSSTGSPVDFQVSATTSNCSGFLSAVANGGNPAMTYGDQNHVVVSINTNGLKTGTCTGNIKVTVPNSSTPALNIPVTLNVSDNALLNVGTNAVNATMLLGSSPATQIVAVTSTDSSVLTFTATAATDPIGLTWLSVAPNTANTSSNLLLTLNPENLGVGTYDGSISVVAPNLPAETIHVTLTVVSSNISANFTNLPLTAPMGTSANQSIQISGIPSGTTIGALTTTFNGTGWLTATTSGNTVMVTANASNLQQGPYSGVVTVIAPGAGNSPLYIPVTLTVTAANSLLVSQNNLTLTYQIGATLPTVPNIQVTSTVPGITFTTTFVPSSGGLFLSVSPTTGVTPEPLTLTLNPAVVTSLGVGAFSGSIVVSSPGISSSQTIAVTLTVLPAPAGAITSLLNAASFTPARISPGELITIFGTNLGPTQGVSWTPDNGFVDTNLGGTMVFFNNTAAPLLYVSATQINAIVPYEVAPFAVVSISVNRGGLESSPLALSVNDTDPGIFSVNQSGNGQGAILNQNLSPNSSFNPAPKGSIVSIFVTGEGALSPAAATGSISGPSLPLPKPIANVSVTIGGQPAEISYAGEAPGLVSGVLQVNATVPNNIPSGNQPVVVIIGSNSNVQQTITVAVE